MPPPFIPTALVSMESNSLQRVTLPLAADGVTAPLLGVSVIPSGVDAFVTTPIHLANFHDAPFEPSLFRSPGDFMTGGNRHHNAEADYLVREIVRRVEAVRQQSVDPAVVRDWVHQELVHFKDNGGDQYNGNVSRSDWSEVIDHGFDRFAGRSRESVRTVESSEGMHWRIEELIETEMMRPENASLLSDRNLEALRSTLRTRLRSEFSGMLMNEWGSERLEDISDFMRSGIVADFEGRAVSIVADGISSTAACTMTDAVPAAPAPAVALPSAWSEVLTRPVSAPAVSAALNSLDPRLAEYFEREISNAASPITTMSELLVRVSAVDPTILDQAAAAATAEGRPLTEMSERGIFELITRAAQSRGNWSLSDPTRLADMSGRFERSLRPSPSPSDRPGAVEAREREERERREVERRRGRP